MRIDNNYKADVPVRVKGTKIRSKVHVGTMVHGITDLDEVKQTFMARFTLKVGWYDYRLLFENLHEKQIDNIINKDIASVLWIPPLTISSSASDA